MVLASRLDSRTRQRDALTPGERAVWHLDRDLPEDEIDLEGPEDTSVALESRPRRSGMDFLSEPLDRIGLYTWRHNDRPSEYDAVNFPSIESDLRSMDADELKRDEAVALVSGSELRRLRDGIKLWPGLLALTLCLAMTEFAVIKWAEKT